MKTLLAMLIMVSVSYGQAKTIPEQGPPPKNLTKRPDGHFSANGDPANPEKFETYIVKTGDTLSGISGQVLKNACLWPQLWEQNEHIVNPHWIYPNDKILIKPITTITEAAPPPPPTPEPEPAPAPSEPPKPTPPPVRSLEPAPAPPRAASTFDLTPRRPAPEIKPGDVYCSGFVRKEPVPTDLKVTAKYNSLGGALATKGDYIYISHGSEDGVKPGDRYYVIRPTRRINSPTPGPRILHELGMHYLDIAQIQVMTTQPDFSMARISSSCEAVEIGDLMVPFQPREVPTVLRGRTFDPLMRPSGNPVSGTVAITRAVLTNFGSTFKASGIIAGANSSDPSLMTVEKGIAGEGTIVYVDLGRSKGVKPGDILIVYRPVEIETKLYALKESQRLRNEKTAIGELVVLNVELVASSALVTYSSIGISAGDYVERK